MMDLPETLSTGHNDKEAARFRERLPVTESSALGRNAGASTTPDLRTPSRNARGASCPIQTFMSDRQRLMRSWLALQGQAPAHIIADELVSTISALRQLVELRE